MRSEIKPICYFCHKPLPKGSHFGSVHKACYEAEVALIRETHGEEADGHLDGLAAKFCPEDLV